MDEARTGVVMIPKSNVSKNLSTLLYLLSADHIIASGDEYSNNEDSFVLTLCSPCAHFISLH